MNITELSVRRPTLIVIFVVLCIGLGILGYTSMGADLFPAANTPVVAIVTTYSGAGTEEIEKDIVKPIEDAVSAIGGIDTIRSTSGEGYGSTVIMFNMSTEMSTAILDVQNAIDSIAADLPKDASSPAIYKYDLNAQPILTVSLSSTASYEELYTEAEKVRNAMEKLPGIGNVTLLGAYEKELSITLDKTRLEFYGIDANTVIGSLKSDNMNIPAGQIKQDAMNKTVRILGEFKNVNDIRNLAIPLAGGSTIRLDEIAAVELKYPEAESLTRHNGTPAIGILVQKQSDANIVETANHVKKELERMKPALLSGTRMVIANDATLFINSSLDETRRNLLEGIVTTAIVLFLFLRSWRSSLTVLVAIPTSLVSTFFMMYIFGFTFNILSLMALALCVGILVDDSIVILENIHRHIQMGKSPWQAAIDGRSEIGMAAVAITLCDVVVFAPMALMGDLVGQFFRQFGLTVVVATLFSLLVSFTLTPLLASRIYAGKNGKQPVVPETEPAKAGRFSSFFDKYIKQLYKNFLLWSLSNRWKIIALFTAGVVLSVLMIPFGFLSTEFLPKFDQGRLMINLKLTPGTNLRTIDEKVMEVEQYLTSLPEAKDVFTSIGADKSGTSADITLSLKNRNQRKKSESVLARELRTWGSTLSGVNFSVTEPSIVEQTSLDSSKPLVINITGDNNDVLKELSKQVETVMRTVSGVVDIDNSINATHPEISIRFDRLAASQYGISLVNAASALRTAIAGTKAGVYRVNGDEFDILVKFDEQQLKTPHDIGSIQLTNPQGQQIPLERISTIELSGTPEETLRLNRQNVVTLSANMEGRILGDINKELTDKLKSIPVPNGCQIKFGGDQQHMVSSFDSLIKVLIASIILVYMILVILYDSYLTPAIRMLSLPCGMIGALLALVLTGESLNIISMIGLIMLDGLASKNGTLLVDYTNTLMKRGMSLKEALVEAGVTRLRPIMMTSITMIVGMLPLALAMGEGSEIKSGMAIALIGGMVTSTLLSPILLPVVYTLIHDARGLFRKGKKPKEPLNGGIPV
jgi:hydrophobic/amphiphilic exporter-1 (mainly G- bacteria), HAE1 family